MSQRKLNWKRSRRAGLSGLAAAAVILVLSLPGTVSAQQQGQKTFSSPDDAAKALVAAAKDNDQKALLEILGPSAKTIVSSGDETEDANNRANFVRRYQEMHRLVKEPDGTTTLYVGAENWPMPIPLVRNGKVWYFDTPAGKREILYRRIGQNEMSTMRVCEQLVAAEKEYSAQHREYAEKFISDQGREDGLYWKASASEPQSPIGPLVASAVAEGYTKGQSGAPTPYRGYYYRILTAQGANAPGGAKSYIVGGKMTGGFAFIAYPADYRSSGVMTFIVNQQGIIYQKDLGPNTASLAKAMKDYNPGPTWQKPDQQEQDASQQ
jgi:Protein of unknown function (DUF2950)